MDGYRVGIITRTKNRPLLLRRAIQSVANQTYKNYVHIIVNDGDSLEHQTLTGETIIVPINSGGRMEQASNEGVEVAIKEKVDFIAIHDDDDSWSPEFLSIMIQEFRTYENLVPTVKGIICRANCVYEKIEGNVITIDHLEPHIPWTPEIGLLRIADLLDDNNNFAPIQFIYRREAIQTIGRYDPSFLVYGDWDFNLRFLKHYDIALIPNYLAFYHQRISGAASDINSMHEASRFLQREVYRQRIQNRYLREGDALGMLMNIQHLQHGVHELRESVNELRRKKRTHKSH